MADSKTPDNKPKVAEVRSHEQPASAGVYILQWLTYAFWGWLIGALTWLMGIILSNAITGQSVERVVPYAIAATVVLLPLAFVVDFLYRKYEPLKKYHASSIIMVLHAVLFALLGIGTLITTVFVGLSMLIESGRNVDGQWIALGTLGFATILYVGAFLRTLNPFKSTKSASIYSIVMLVASLVLLVISIAGPMAKSISLRDDRRIERHLSSVNSEVQQYVRTNEKLPDSLQQLTLTEDAKALVEDDLVQYKKEGEVANDGSSLSTKSLRYQLCVTYKQASPSNSRYASPSYSSRVAKEYTSYLSTYRHEKGETCYKQETRVYTRPSSSKSN